MIIQEGKAQRLYIVVQDGLGGPPHPVLLTRGDNGDCISFLLDSDYTTIPGWVARVLRNRLYLCLGVGGCVNYGEGKGMIMFNSLSGRA